MLTKYPETQAIGIHGRSLGGAIAIQAMEIDDRIKFGIIESAFADLGEVVFEYQKRIMKVGFPRLTRLTLKRAGKIAGFHPKEVKPEKSAQNVTAPVMITHGEKDKHITPNHSNRIFKSLASRYKTLVIIPGATHTSMWQQGGEKYRSQILTFVERAL